MKTELTMINISAYEIAQRFVGIKEVSGKATNPQILAMLQLDNSWPQEDEVAWCSAFVNYIAWLLRLPRSKSLRARSWLQVGTPVDLLSAKADCDVVILKRGDSIQGPEVIEAPGHVGFFSGFDIPTQRVLVLGGNQKDSVCVESFPASKILGIRRLV